MAKVISTAIATSLLWLVITINALLLGIHIGEERAEQYPCVEMKRTP